MAGSDRIRAIFGLQNANGSYSEQMKRLKSMLTDLNIGLAYDDFGVGQTRLVELAKMPPDYLKFDISIIRNIHIAPNRLHQMVLTFIRAAHDLGIATLAEGIECREESETCKQLGFQYAQGYLYGHPLPVSAFSRSKKSMSVNKKVKNSDTKGAF